MTQLTLVNTAEDSRFILKYFPVPLYSLRIDTNNGRYKNPVTCWPLLINQQMNPHSHCHTLSMKDIIELFTKAKVRNATIFYIMLRKYGWSKELDAALERYGSEKGE